MALQQLYANNAMTILSDAITSDSGTLRVPAEDAGLFPDPNPLTQYFLVTLEDPETKNYEIVRVTQRSGTSKEVFSIIRSQEGTLAKAFAAGCKVQLRVTKETLENLRDFSLANAAYVHTQASDSSTWTFTHGLNRYPGIAIIIDEYSGATLIGSYPAEADVVHVSNNQVTITFSEAVRGRVLCS